MKVELIHLTPNALALCAGAMSKCYDKNVSPASVVKYGVQSGHFSVLEHAHATFDIECSLAVLGQLTRHRHLSFTVKSSRGAMSHYPGDYDCPRSIQSHPSATKHIEQTFQIYKDLIQSGVPTEDAAYLLPKGTVTKLRVTGNLRAWLEYLPKRLCLRAMPEHREVAKEIKRLLAFELPEVFANVTTSCDTCKETKCEF